MRISELAYLIPFVECVGPQGQRAVCPGQLLDAHAHTVARAVVGALVALAGRPREAIEARALA